MDEEANNESLHSLFQITLYLVSSPYPTMLRGNTIIWGKMKREKRQYTEMIETMPSLSW